MDTNIFRWVNHRGVRKPGSGNLSTLRAKGKLWLMQMLQQNLLNNGFPSIASDLTRFRLEVVNMIQIYEIGSHHMLSYPNPNNHEPHPELVAIMEWLDGDDYEY